MHVHAELSRDDNRLSCEEVEAAIAGYMPKAVDPVRWSEIVRDVTVVACDAGFAKLEYLSRALSSLSSFVTACGGFAAAPWELSALLTDSNVERYVVLAVQDGLTHLTVRNRRSDLTRLMRAMRGLPRRERSAAVGRRVVGGVRELLPVELMDRVADCSPATRAAMAVAVGTGLRPCDLDADPAVLEVTAQAVRVRLGATCCDLPVEVAHQVRDCNSRLVDRETWQRARREASGAGLEADANDLRQVWVNGLASKPTSIRSLVVDHGVNYRALDAVPRNSRNLPETASNKCAGQRCRDT